MKDQRPQQQHHGEIYIILGTYALIMMMSLDPRPNRFFIGTIRFHTRSTMTNTPVKIIKIQQASFTGFRG